MRVGMRPSGEDVSVTIELTPELIAICVSFVGLLVAFGTIAGRLIKIGRWMQGIDNRLDNLEKGQVQLLDAVQNHVHEPQGAPPLFFTPVMRPYVPPNMTLPGDVPAASGQAEPAA